MFVIIIVLLLLMIMMFHLHNPSKALVYGPPFYSVKPHNQLTILTTEMSTDQTIQTGRLNRKSLQKTYQLVLAMEDKRQVQSSLNRVSAMPRCRCWGAEEGTWNMETYRVSRISLFFSNLGGKMTEHFISV